MRVPFFCQFDFVRISLISGLAIIVFGSAPSNVSHAAEGEGAFWNNHIRPLFKAQCWKCHGGAKQKGGLDLRTIISTLKGGDSGEHGAGLMETLVQHPSGKYFVMAGRLFKGNWNVAFFDTTSGKLLHSFDCGMRCIKARFNAAGDKLFIAGAVSQKNDIKKKDKPNFGRIKIFTIT